MEFFLPISVTPAPQPINYQSKLLMMGSCFSEEIGGRLRDRKFNVLQNPSGILYHPLNISEILMRCISGKCFVEDDLFESKGIWHSWHHHSSFSGYGKEDVLKKTNKALDEAARFLRSATHLILTPATAWAYYHKKSDCLVSNCHKQPAAIFEKRLSTPEEIFHAFSDALKQLKKLHPHISVMITISPVKHLRDGAVQNNLSKATLMRAVYLLKCQREDVYYFPSFEIMNDELRDYRFYKSDMAHPNTAAVDYIFQKYCNACIEKASLSIMEQVVEILRAAAHRPAFTETQEHKKFIAVQLKKISALEQQCPGLDFEKERKALSGTL